MNPTIDQLQNAVTDATNALAIATKRVSQIQANQDLEIATFTQSLTLAEREVATLTGDLTEAQTALTTAQNAS